PILRHAPAARAPLQHEFIFISRYPSYMPELPEVEVTRRGVAPHLEDRVVEDVVLRREGLRWPFPPNLHELLAGRRILGTGRRGKYLLLTFEHGTLIIHLGM